MIVWLKSIGIIVVIIMALEVTAWVGIYLFGWDFFDKLRSRQPTPTVTGQDGRKCTTFDGEIFCINKEDNINETNIEYLNLPEKPEQLSKNNRVEKCATFDGQIFCIKEKK